MKELVADRQDYRASLIWKANALQNNLAKAYTPDRKGFTDLGSVGKLKNSAAKIAARIQMVEGQIKLARSV